MRPPLGSSQRRRTARGGLPELVLAATLLLANRAPAQAAPAHTAAPEDPAALTAWLDRHLGGRQDRARAAAALRAALAAPATDAPGLPRAAQRCALGVVLEPVHVARRHLAACDDPSVPSTLRERAQERRAALDAKLRRSALSPYDLSAEEPGWLGALDDAPDAWFVLPHTAWLPSGTHELRVAPRAATLAAGGGERRVVVAQQGKRGAVHLAAPRVRPTRTEPVVLDLGEEAALEAPTAGPPPPEPHRSLLPRKSQRGVRATADVAQAAPERGALTLHASAGRAWAGGGTVRVALAARTAVSPRLAAELGFDGHHAYASAMERGGSGLGASAGVRVLMWAPHQVSLLVGARARLALDAAEGPSWRAGALAQLSGKPMRSWPVLLGAEAELEPSWQAVAAVLAVELWRR